MSTSTAQRLQAIWRSGENFAPRRPAAFAAPEKASLPPPDFVLLTPKEFAERHCIPESDVLALICTRAIAVIQLPSACFVAVPQADRDLLHLKLDGR